MRRALSVLDNKDLNAVEFSTQEEDWQDSRRGALTCLGCAAPAFFRTATLSRSASFGAFHSNYCLLVRTRTVFQYQD